MPVPTTQDSTVTDKSSNNTSSHNGQWWHTPLSASIGGSAGAYICFPFEGLKKRWQTGQPISFRPTELYRGATPFAVSVTLATVTQMSFNSLFQKIPGYDKESPAWNTASAVASGALGAAVGSTPVENIILTQQLNKTGPIDAIRIMMKQGYTRPWVGLPQLAFREAGFGLTMLYGAQAARDFVYNKTNSNTMATAGSIAFSLVGAAATHPFDTVATIRQHADGKKSSLKTVKDLIAKEGASGLYKGFFSRALLFTGCALIIPEAQKTALTLIEGNKANRL